MCSPDACGAQKRTSDSVALKLMSSGIATSVLNHLAISPVLALLLHFQKFFQTVDCLRPWVLAPIAVTESVPLCCMTITSSV